GDHRPPAAHLRLRPSGPCDSVAPPDPVRLAPHRPAARRPARRDAEHDRAHAHDPVPRTPARDGNVSELVLSSSAIAAGEQLRRRAWIGAWWAGGRLLVLATAAVMHFTGPRALAGRDERSHLLGLLGAWDGRWYRIVAVHGYLLEPGRQSDPAFFPLFPLLLRGLHALDLGYVTAGLLISNLALLGALLAFEPLTRTLFDVRFARRATIYVAVFPLGFVFSMT